MIGAERVRSTVTDLVGRPVASVDRVAGSVANQDFVVRLADGTRVVLKAGPAAELAAEAWACRRLWTVGVPVPEIVALDLDGGDLDGAGLGRPFLVMSFVPGGPSEDRDVAREAGRWFRVVHAQELPGWGSLAVERDSARGRHDSWSAAVLADLAGVEELVTVGILDAELARSACALVEVDTVLGYRGPGVLLHHDLKPAHLFGRDGGGRPRLSAVIDWGDAGVGDPVVDLARLSMAGPAVTTAFLAGYGLGLDPELADRLARHRIRWNLRALTYEHRAGGDWFDVYRDRVDHDTRLLTRRR